MRPGPVDDRDKFHRARVGNTTVVIVGTVDTAKTINGIFNAEHRVDGIFDVRTTIKGSCGGYVIG